MTPHSTLSRVTVDPTTYHREHGKAPRGRGHWAFCPASLWHSADYLKACFWHVGSYGEAKRAAVAHFAAQGVSHVVVCS